MIRRMETQGGGVDVIGDVHGMIETYHAIVEALGYRRREGRWGHPEGRRLVQVGDVLDRGPDPLGALEFTRDLVEDGVADFVLGNHEVSALGWFVGARPHTDRNRKQFAATLRQIEADPARWDACAAFLRAQPLAIERAGLRFVHAAWLPDAIAALPPTLADDAAISETGKGGRYHEAIRGAIRGPLRELDGPDDPGRLDKRQRRSQWWEEYAPDAPLVCFGHYWFSGTPHVLGPAGNAVCLDYGCGRGGPLVAWRWPEHTFFMMPNHDAGRPGFRIEEA